MSEERLSESTAAVARATQLLFAELACDFAFALRGDGFIEAANEGALELLGLELSALKGQHISQFIAPDDASLVEQAFTACVSGPQAANIRLLSALGHMRHVQCRLFRDPASRIYWLVGHDLSAVRQMADELRKQATHDSLTALPNKALLHDRIEQHIREAKRAGTRFSVVVIDLDGFKRVNDGMGHLAGDELLKVQASRLRANVRDMDTVSRTGGDEFVLVLANAGLPADAKVVCERLLDALRKPTEVKGQQVYVTPSLGVALFPEHGQTVYELIEHADRAMYQAKLLGKNRYAFFSEDLHGTTAQQLSLDSAMHAAIQDGEFYVDYQPLVSAHGKVKGCEALLRWRKADGTQVSPAEFIPIAESNGLIALLGDYVLRAAAMQLRRFDEAGLPGLYMSVNVSPRQLRHPNFEQNLKKVLALSGIEPQRLVLEITESLLMNGQHKTQALLQQIAALGVRFFIDDFGTGYSCLSYLKSYPVAGLKVDKTFLTDIETDPVSRSVVRAILDLTRALKLTSVVEGVETRAQADILRELGADNLQGYLFSRPCAPARFIEQFRCDLTANTVS